MSVLPDELWRSIMEIGVQTKSLDYKNLCSLSIVCRRFRRLAAEDSPWSDILLSDFPSPTSNLISAHDETDIVAGDSNYISNGKFKSLYKIRYEKDRVKTRLAHRRAVLRIESEIAEHMRKIRELEVQSLKEKVKLNKTVAELMNLRRVRQAAVAVNVWQPEIIRSRQRQMVQQTNVPVDVRINNLEMEFCLCRQQIAGFDRAIRFEEKRSRSDEQELASLKYHPLQDFREEQPSGSCVRSKKRLKHASVVEDLSKNVK